MMGAPFSALVGREWRTVWTERSAYTGRALYAAVLLAAALLAWLFLPEVPQDRSGYAPAAARRLFGLFSEVQFGLATFLAILTFSRAVCRELEGGTMDLLLLSPLTRLEILTAKLAGEFLGLVVLVATGLPVVLLILPLGGVSPGDIVLVHVTLLAQILFVGAASVACAAMAKRRIPVLVLVSAILFLVFAGPGLVRLRWPAAAAVCGEVDSWTPLGLLKEQLGGPLPQPLLAGKAVLFALLSAAAGCATGSLFLDLLVHRGHRLGSLVLSRIIKRLARRPRVEWLFRSHHWSDHPLLEHDLRTTRSLGSALFWAALMVGYALLAREMLSGTGLREWAEHLEVPALGLTLAGAVAILQGAFTVGARRRSGSLELILSTGVAPEDLIRSLLVLMVRRSLVLSALPALHLILVEIDLFGPWALLWRIPAVVAAVLLSSTVMAGIVLWFSFSIARMELAAFVALLVALPTGVLLFASLTTTLASAAVTLPLIAGALLSGYARLIRRVPKGVLP